MRTSIPMPLVQSTQPEESVSISSELDNTTEPYKPDEPCQCWIKNCKCTPDCIAWTPEGCRVLLLLESIANAVRISGISFGTTD